jgi:hypothetical protein
MTEHHSPDPTERHELTEQDLAIARLVGRYVERREQGVPARVGDLLAVAAEFGEAAVDDLRSVLAFYEACARATPQASDAPAGELPIHKRRHPYGQTTASAAPVASNQ